MFLFRVGSGQGVRATAGHFDIAEGTVVDWTLSVANLVIKRLYSECVRWPDAEEQQEISKDWEAEKGLRQESVFSHWCRFLLSPYLCSVSWD